MIRKRSKKSKRVAFSNCPEYCPLTRAKKCKRGDIVKVSAYAERFWVRVVSSNSRRICGRVDNNLLTPKLKYNDRVCFSPRKVYRVLDKSGKEHGGGL